MWHKLTDPQLVVPSARGSFKASPHKDAILIPVKLKTLLFGPKPPFYLARAGSRVLFSQPFHLFHHFSPSFSQLSPRSNPQPLMPMSSFLPFSPCNDRILLLTRAAKHLNAKTQGSRHGLNFGIWPAQSNLKSKLHFLKVTRTHKGQNCMLWFTCERRIYGDYQQIKLWSHQNVSILYSWVPFSSGVILLVLNDCTVYTIGISFLGDFYYGAHTAYGDLGVDVAASFFFVVFFLACVFEPVQNWLCRLHKGTRLSGKASVETAGSRPLIFFNKSHPSLLA